jgi:cation diffusion facilitator CzcD-associated flavoprotein CzcO
LQDYPSNTPIWLPRTKLANFMEYYAFNQEIPIWTSTSMMPNPEYDREKNIWDVKVQREGRIQTLNPRHLIMAVGLNGAPKVPSFKGLDLFKGPVLHTAQYKNAKGWENKKVVIIGMV